MTSEQEQLMRGDLDRLGEVLGLLEADITHAARGVRELQPVPGTIFDAEELAAQASRQFSALKRRWEESMDGPDSAIADKMKACD